MISRFALPASSLIAALLAISSPAAAQTQPAQPDTSPPAAHQGASAEPASSEAAESSREEEGYVPEDAPAAEKETAGKERSAPSAASLNANRRVQDPNQPLRIVGEVLLSFLVSGLGAYGGSLIATSVLFGLGFNAGNALFFGATIGGGIGAGLVDVLCVWVMGALVQGRGQFGSTLVGGLIGTGIAVGINVGIMFLSLMNPMLAIGLSIVSLVGGIVPILGAVLGYETSHMQALRSAAPVAVPLQLKGGGSGIALAWAI